MLHHNEAQTLSKQKVLLIHNDRTITFCDITEHDSNFWYFVTVQMNTTENKSHDTTYTVMAQRHFLSSTDATNVVAHYGGMFILKALSA